MIRRKRNLITKVIITSLICSALIFDIGVYAKAKVINFKDNNLENHIKSILKNDTGDFTKEEIDNLNELEIDDENVWSLNGLENFNNIASLNIYNSNVADLSPIYNLGNFQCLYLENSCLTDISLLKRDNFKNLKVLILNNNNININNIEPLRNLKKLRVISLFNNEVRDLSPLESLPYENDYKWPYDESEKEKIAQFDYNILDTSENDKVITNLKNKGFEVSNQINKYNIYVDRINGDKFNYMNEVNINKGVTLEFNEDIENIAKKLEVYSIRDNEYTKLNYIVSGNKMNINFDKALIKDGKADFEVNKDSDVLLYASLKIKTKCREDVDGNGYVNIDDLCTVAKDYNKSSKDAESWNIKEDVNKDGVIDIYDISKISAQLED